MFSDVLLESIQRDQAEGRRIAAEQRLASSFRKERRSGASARKSERRQARQSLRARRSAPAGSSLR